ncbi:bis-aminopropyl spermidine synthase family protein [Myceligenerans crystallogenes]|uniref:Bis-aminopropyl spermidine synthase family protein n=1 Tax=Myceligenerans crystallogenes TaxID=316335 RepID=A0ABN2NK48_9MICO
MASRSEVPGYPDVAEGGSPLERVRELVRSFGVAGRGHREAVAMLADGCTLAGVVRATAVPRRLVEQVLGALGDDLVSDGERLRIRPDKAGEYREAFGAARLGPTAVELPGEGRLRDADALIGEMERIIAAAPRPKKALDHVPATPETAVRRALWLDGTYELAGATLLCIGDHDLTSIVTCLVNPAVRAVVVDLDEDLLAYVGQVAAERGLRIETGWADFRFGLPASARECADLVFTDPPYTPDGVRLFLARGLEGLRDREHGRLLMAYGFGSHHPGLGYNVQQAAGDLSLVYEAILPHFNRYDGAQAVGSASDLYVCRPTARTWRSLSRVATDAVTIYTHGTQSSEARSGRGEEAVTEAVRAAARGQDELEVAADVPLGAVLDGTAQASVRNARTTAYAADLSDDPGAWLFRALLGVTARRVAVAVPNGHPDIGSEAAQSALRDDLAGKWTLTFRRSTPDPRHAVVVADEAGATTDPVAAARRVVLSGASRNLGNAWRDALVKAARAGGGSLGKAEAREIVASAAASAGLPDETLARPLATLPRSRVRAVLSAVVGSLPQVNVTARTDRGIVHEQVR